MLRKIILLAIIVFGLYMFYKKFAASTTEPFFKNESGKVGLYKLSITKE